MIPLLSNSAAATGAATLVERPGTYLWSTAGTFGGGSVALQYLASNGTTWTALRTITAGETAPVFITEDTYVRAVATGGGTAGLSSALKLGSGAAFDMSPGTGSIGTAQLADASVSTAKLIDANVTSAKLANMANATVKARITAGTGVPEDATGAQIRDTVVPSGFVIDRVYAEYLTNADLTTVIPIDDTIPQVGEGTEVLSIAITPKSTTNRVRVRFQGWGSISTVPGAFIAALFVNGAANAVRGNSFYIGTANYTSPILLEFEHVPGSVSAQTYSIRVGASAGTARLNGNAVARFFGGVAAATLVVEELKA